MREWTGDLFVTNHTRKLLDATVQLYELPNRQLSIIRPFVLATLATVPAEWHQLLAPGESRLEENLAAQAVQTPRSEEHTSELQSLMRIPYAVFCLKKTKQHTQNNTTHTLS